ncbi:hypothetical protein A0H76_2403 [Hepatospora eriocheir]|uniref:Uncharacterized protein n=1 Tax=Hepatospora eriocheir TaxID=1081669 RepID=A0A1X0QK25_9MICR|nr:hypothetical protein A0H76_2403 [Hepatospora eriocheir]
MIFIPIITIAFVYYFSKIYKSIVFTSINLNKVFRFHLLPVCLFIQLNTLNVIVKTFNFKYLKRIDLKNSLWYI